jgi:hypothetical protein
MKRKKVARPEGFSVDDSTIFEGDALHVLQPLPANGHNHETLL